MDKSMAASSSSSSNHDNSSSSSSSSSNEDKSASVASYEASMSYIRLVGGLNSLSLSPNDSDSAPPASVASFKASMSYIRFVQNLIERCLMLCMDQGECVHALAIHAAIPTAVTTAVWKELEKTNPEFFHSYFTQRRISPCLRFG